MIADSSVSPQSSGQVAIWFSFILVSSALLVLICPLLLSLFMILPIYVYSSCLAVVRVGLS